MLRFRSLFFTATAVLAGCATPTGGIAPAGSTVTLQPAPLVQVMPGTTPRAAGKTEVLWLGQAATRITTPGGKVIMIDPWLTSNPKTPAQWKNLDALGKVDLILVTHAHTDHFEDAPVLAKKNHAPILSPQGLQSQLISLNLVPAELSVRVGKGGNFLPFGPSGVKITQVHAEHDSELTWTDPASHKRETLAGGEPVGYIIEMENGFKVWHMGDTGVFGDMRLIGEMFHPDVVLAPIGNHFVMGPHDAAMVMRDWVRPKYVIPIHYGTTPQLRGTPAEMIQAMGNATVPRILVPEPGQKYDF